MYTVSLEKFIQKMKVKNLTPDVDISAIEITQSDVNRPALQLAVFLIILTITESRLSVR